MIALAPEVPAAPSLDAPSGLPGLERLPWGTHVCQFYRTEEDLRSVLVPYFEAGLRSGDACLWIAAPPLPAEAARRALAAEVPDLEVREREGQIEILDHRDWYLRGAHLTTEEVARAWLQREEAALRAGRSGLRLTGNTSFLRRDDWEAFAVYEARVDRLFRGRRILALCSYLVADLRTEEILDVVRHHGIALARQGDTWAALRGATEVLEAVRTGGPSRRLHDASAPRGHDAVLYRPGEYPVDPVARFVAEGLDAGEGVCVLLTEEHVGAVRGALLDLGVDVAGAEARGQLVAFRPAETLPRLLEGGAISPERFASIIPPAMEALWRRFGGVRAYGEMADLLASRGAFSDALALEGLWNDLLRQLPVRVLCTYDARAFEAPDGERRLHLLDAEHEHVEGQRASRAALGDLVGELARATRALDEESRRRAELEAERDRWESASRVTALHLARLQRVTSTLLAAHTARELEAALGSSLAEAAGATAVLVAALEGDGTLSPVSSAGARSPGALAPGAEAAAAALAQARSLWVEEAEEGARWWPRAAAVVALPLEARGVSVGALVLAFDHPRRFAEPERAFHEDLARQAALALERVRLVADLERAREAAEAASRAKDEFLAMLGHELRNPLSPMVTVLHLMERRAPEAFAHERAILGRQLRHMERLVDDLLDVSRIVRGKLELKRERIELAAAVTDALQTAAPLLEARRHQVEVHVPLSGLPVDGDRQRLSQVVVNLLTNAARYTPPGGHVRITAEQRGDRVALHVSDDGQGMSEELAARAFNLFEQGPRCIARSEGGLGLGLAIVRSVAELHGGSARVKSAGPGCGCTFTVELPRAGHAETPAVQAAPRPLRVLVVDDSEDAASTLAELLACAGYEARVAHTPAAALDLAASFAPEVALLDIGLAGMDGWTLGARLRALCGARTPHLVAVTGYGVDGDHARSQLAGFVAHLVKPLDLGRLQRILDGLAASRDESAARAS